MRVVHEKRLFANVEVAHLDTIGEARRLVDDVAARAKRGQFRVALAEEMVELFRSESGDVKGTHVPIVVAGPRARIPKLAAM